MIRKILTQGDEFSPLRKPCVHVKEFDPELTSLVVDMWDTMYSAHGLGLAATQIGSSLRVAVVDVPQNENSNRRLALVNLHIEEFRGEQTGSEGCRAAFLHRQGDAHLVTPVLVSRDSEFEFEDFSPVLSAQCTRGGLAGGKKACGLRSRAL